MTDEAQRDHSLNERVKRLERLVTEQARKLEELNRKADEARRMALGHKPKERA
jgi:uncharacterized coiled-coil protein SlyX